MVDAPEYKVEDRSVLLPIYKRLLVEPVLPRIPARLSANAITHVGHLLCLAALAVLLPSPGLWSFLASALLLHAYLWCDNADGAHARRTGQASPAGEYLDHGLDLLNCAYIGVVSAFSIGLQDRPTGLVLASVIPAAAALTAWEQAVTGVYRLAALNQIESLFFLTFLLVLDVVFGGSVFERAVLGIRLQSWIFVFVVGNIGLQTTSALLRVRGAGRSLLPALAFVALLASVWAARATAGLAPHLAYALCATFAIAFGAHCLRARVAAEALGWPTTLVPAAAGATVLAASRVLDGALASGVSIVIVALGVGLTAVDALEIARRASAGQRARAAVPEINE